MQTALWTTQVLWGIFFSLNGFGKICCIDQDLWNQSVRQVAWFAAIPRPLFIFIGVCEFLGGIGLILPALTGVKPRLTPLAGLGLTLVMCLAAVFHVVRGEFVLVPVNVILGAVAAFIAYGRGFVRPVAPASLSAVALLKAVAVAAALVLVDVAPVWYRLASLH
jgi:hypothetical protein